MGQPAPDFTLKDTCGKTVRPSDFRGKHVVLGKHYGARTTPHLYIINPQGQSLRR